MVHLEASRDLDAAVDPHLAAYQAVTQALFVARALQKGLKVNPVTEPGQEQAQVWIGGEAREVLLLVKQIHYETGISEFWVVGDTDEEEEELRELLSTDLFRVLAPMIPNLVKGKDLVEE